MISEKYIAGLIDSDGWIGFTGLQDGYTPKLCISIDQKTTADEVLQMIQKDYGGNINHQIINGSSYTKLLFTSKYAKMLLSRLSKHLVIKRTYALWCLHKVDQCVEDKIKFRQMCKQARQIKSLPLPNYPSRKWLAGYFDGDGCISVQRVMENNKATIVATIACHNNDTAGLEIIHKNFKGHIYDMAKGNCKQWRLMHKDQLEKFIDYFAKHSVIKNAQLYATLEYLRSQQPDGKRLNERLKELKLNPQRLNEKRLQDDVIVRPI